MTLAVMVIFSDLSDLWLQEEEKYKMKIQGI